MTLSVEVVSFCVMIDFRKVLISCIYSLQVSVLIFLMTCSLETLWLIYQQIPIVLYAVILM